MVRTENKKKNYTEYNYIFEKTTVRYVVMDETKSVFMNLIPNGLEDRIWDDYFTVKAGDTYPDNRDWFPGALVHLHLSHHHNSSYNNSYKISQSYWEIKFDSQSVEQNDGVTTIKTIVKSNEGYSVLHELSNYDGENGFEVKTTFINETGKNVTLEYITSASLDNMCPFNGDDSSKNLKLHTFRGGWSVEGKHIVTSIPELNLEKSWGGSFESEIIGTVGSKSTIKYFPYVALEDTDNGCMWGMKLVHNATWQAELSRYAIDLSLSIGLGDRTFGGWYKNLENGESFEAPVAYIAAVEGDIADLSDDILKMSDRDIKAYGEQGMPVVFNEWCTNWGKHNHDIILGNLNGLKDSDIKYFVIDAGWYDGTVGDWIYSKEKFPKGIKAIADEIRSRGKIPGIWFELESVREGARLYNSDELFLTKGGIPLVTTVNCYKKTKHIDLRKPEAWNYLTESVIAFLKENGFGYIKVDYNTNICLGCDGAESLGEGLRQYMDSVYKFFCKIKEEIPDIVIEDCASGGGRLDSRMLSCSAMASFSDAHECREIPVVAANLQYLIPAKQSQIWATMKTFFDKAHAKYTISSAFMGRLCWSGDFGSLEDWQMDMVFAAEKFYARVSHIIENGKSRIYRTNAINNRYLEGSQASVRYSDDESEILLVCHFFDNAEPMKIKLLDNYEISASLYEHNCRTEDKYLIIEPSEEYSGNVITLRKK